MRPHPTGPAPTRFVVVLIAAAGVPLVYSTAFNDPFTTPKLYALALAVGVALLAFLPAGSGPMPWPSPARLLIAFAAWSLLATVVSRAPWVSALGFYGRADGFVSLVLMAVLGALVVVLTWSHPERLEVLAWSLVAAAVLGAAYVWLQRMGLDWYEWRRSSGLPVARPQGALGNSNFSGAHLAMSTPLAVALAIGARGWPRTIALAVLPLLGGGIWFTGSRAAMLAVVVAVGVVLWFAPYRLARRSAPVVAAIGLAGVATSAAVIVSGATSSFGPLSGLDAFRTESLEVRSELWAGAVRAITAHPVIGTGPDTFVVTYLEHRGPGSVAFEETVAIEPHNILLDHAVSTGMVGLLLFGALVASVVRPARHHRRHLLLGGFVGMLTAYLTQGMFSVDTVGLTVGGWVAMGAIVAISDPRLMAARAETDIGLVARGQQAVRASRDSVSTPMWLGTALIMAGFVVALSRPVRADLAARDAAALPRGDLAAVGHLQRSVDLLAVQPRYHLLLAQRRLDAAHTGSSRAETAAAQLDAADDAAHRALDLFPDDVAALQTLSDIEIARARLGDEAAVGRAIDILEHALTIDPHGWTSLERLGAAYVIAASDAPDRDQLLAAAIGAYVRSGELTPDRREPWLVVAELAKLAGDDGQAERAEVELDRIASDRSD